MVCLSGVIMLHAKGINVIRYNNYWQKTYFWEKKRYVNVYTMQCENYYKKDLYRMFSKFFSYMSQEKI